MSLPSGFWHIEDMFHHGLNQIEGFGERGEFLPFWVNFKSA